MGTQTETSAAMTRGRGVLWLFHAAALLIPAACFVYGARIYGSLPETVPTHWGAGGEPDAWADKSFGSVFAPVLVGAGTSVFLGIIAAAAPLMIPATRDTSPWENWRREGTIRGTIAAMGGTSLLLAALMGLLAVAGWNNPDSLPLGPLLVLVALILANVFVVYSLCSRWARRTALRNGVSPTEEEAEEDKLWVAGGFYNNPADPRVLVPKRSGSGTGLTVNVGHRKGRAAVVVFLAVCVGLPLLFGVIFSL